MLQIIWQVIYSHSFLSDLCVSTGGKVFICFLDGSLKWISTSSTAYN